LLLGGRQKGHFEELEPVMRWLMNWWRQRQRAIDLSILWPACKEQATDLDHAKAAFAMHAFHDPAWLALGDDEIRRQIDALS
jgi:hypothetical protein